MIALDTNILVQLMVEDHPSHLKTKKWLLKNTEKLCTTFINIGETLRLLTHPKVFSHSLTLLQAIELIETNISGLEIIVLEESEEWVSELKALSKKIPSIKGNEVFDARIALALKNNGITDLMTLDNDFLKFSFLKIVSL